MKKYFIPFLLFSVFFYFGCASLNYRSYTPEEVLGQIKAIDSFKKISNDPAFDTTYEVWFSMPIDHADPKSPVFPIRVYYSHKGFDKPVLVILDGYTMYTSREHELSSILGANQITIEHRFFGNSRPKDSIPWSYLKVDHAAADEHAIIQAFKPFYKNKWVSTGISKSGQTTIFHRSLYSDDVIVSVPYVAPLNFSNEDPRVYTFLKKVGTETCRKQIHDYQTALFERKKDIFPMFTQLANKNNWYFSMGNDRAYDLSVLEYSFAFWQWNGKCSDIPTPTSSTEQMFEHWKEIDPFTFFEESTIETIRPFFYQAMTEIGMYGYEVKPFEKYLKDSVNIIFDFTMPKGHPAIFDSSTMMRVQKWIETYGNNMLYIYGENDAWSSTSVEVGNKTNAVKMINPAGNHGTRIRNFPLSMQDSILSVLERWLDVNLSQQREVLNVKLQEN